MLHKYGCLAVFLYCVSKKSFYWAYIKKESYHCLLPELQKLKYLGLNPTVFILDGNKPVIRALLDTYFQFYQFIEKLLYPFKKEI
jgi:hypothetical protein